MRHLICWLILIALAPVTAVACGQDSDCRIGDRVYRIAMPEGADTPLGALIFNHGYRGSHRGAMKNAGLVALAHAHGMALVSTKSASQDWLIPGVPENPAETGETEFAYFDAVIRDLVIRHGIDDQRLIVTGFSAGGMMVWNLACRRGRAFVGFIPVAGTFWDPVPSECPTGPVDIVHVHGTSDKIVPLTGRPIGPTRQGSVFTALETIGAGYGDRRPLPRAEDLTCAGRDGPKGEILGFCTHPGGHSFKVSYLEAALQLLYRGGVPRPRAE